MSASFRCVLRPLCACRCWQDVEGAIGCVKGALESDLDPTIPPELTVEAHSRRVREIFEPLFSE